MGIRRDIFRIGLFSARWVGDCSMASEPVHGFCSFPEIDCACFHLFFSLFLLPSAPHPTRVSENFTFLFTNYFSKTFAYRINSNPRHFLRLNPDSALFPALSVLILGVNPTHFLFCKHTLTNTLVIYTFRIRNFCKQLIVCTPPVGCLLQFERTVQTLIRQTGVLLGFRSGVVYSKMKL